MSGWQILSWASVCFSGTLVFLSVVAHKVECIEASFCDDGPRNADEDPMIDDVPVLASIGTGAGGADRAYDAVRVNPMAAQVDATPG